MGGGIVRYGTLNYMTFHKSGIPKKSGRRIRIKSYAERHSHTLSCPGYRSPLCQIVATWGWAAIQGGPKEGVTQVSPRIYKNFSSTAPLRKPHLPILFIEEFSNLLQSRKNPTMTSSNSGIKWINCLESLPNYRKFSRTFFRRSSWG